MRRSFSSRTNLVILELQNLSVSYDGDPVVRDLSLSLGESEILMLVGPTGCGKTTILRAVAGLVPVSAGEIRLGERLIGPGESVPPEKRNVGMVFQDFALFPHLTVEKNIGFRLRDKKLAEHWLATLGLGFLRKALPDTLSGGQKQRVALARALAHEPGLILLDEPLSNLDASLKDTLRWTIRDALKEAGVPALWVTHDQDEALSIGDRVGVLKEGRLEQIDTPEGCFARPTTRFVAEFLGEASFLPGRMEGGRVESALGRAAAVVASSAPEGTDEVDILVRPDDLSLSLGDGASCPANGRVAWARYEGGSRLYAVVLEDGSEVRIRVSHEIRHEPGDPVHVAFAANHPLRVFGRG